MSLIDRIRTEHVVEAMVAPDTFLMLAQRVERLLSHGRKLAAAHSYATYTGEPPEAHPGLTVTGVRDGHGIWVTCEPSFGFGFDVGDDRTESDAWKRYHAGQHEADSFFDRRRDMTVVEVTGGRELDGPMRDDRIVIRAYNGDGVCDEKVIVFDSGAAR